MNNIKEIFNGAIPIYITCIRLNSVQLLYKIYENHKTKLDFYKKSRNRITLKKNYIVI